MLVFRFGKYLVPTYICVKAECIGSEVRTTVACKTLSRTLLNLRNSDTSTVLQSKCWRYEWCGGNAQKTGAAMECVREYFLGLNFLFTFFFKKKSESGYRADSPNRSKLTEIYFRNSPSEIRLLPSLFFRRGLKPLFWRRVEKKDLSKFAFSGDIFRNIVFQIAIDYLLSNPLKHSWLNSKWNKSGINNSKKSS